tara:strand:- start:4880 stop:6181 length:1302 start_codon:yes stop_codon:yes gene_type:complete
LVKTLIRNLFLALLSSLLWTGCSSSDQPKGSVYIEKTGGKFQLIRHGEPFIIKGVSGEVRLKELAEIGGNCIRTYDTTNLAAILDEAQSLNIAVIAGIWLPKSNSKWFYPNDSLVAEASIKLKALAKKHSDHPALLSWCLGNELIYYDIKDWRFAKSYNQILDSLKSGDPNHPVGTALANYGDKAILNFGLKIRDIDLLYINTFGRLNQLEPDREKWTWLLNKPFVVGEFGENGPWESDGTVWGAPGEINSSQKAERLAAIYDNILPKDNPAFLGSLAFFWGWRQEQTHTWFNVFSQEGEKNEMYFKLAKRFGKELKTNQPPKVGLLSIDSIFDANELLLNPSSTHFAELIASDPEKDSLNYHWTIRTEDWFFVKGEEPPAALENTVLSPHTTEGKTQFKSPSKPGPYRLFVKITDGHGNFGSVNLPFYVVPE